MSEIEAQLKIIEEYQDKVAELNHLLNEGMLDRDEYDELVQDFKDVDVIRNNIKNGIPIILISLNLLFVNHLLRSTTAMHYLYYRILIY